MNWLYNKLIYLRCYLNIGLYNSIYDMPQWNWDMLNKTGNFIFLIRKKYYDNVQEKYSNKILLDRYYKIADQLLEKYGLSDTRIKILEKQYKRRDYQIKYIMDGDMSLINLINMLTIDIEDLNKENEHIMNYDKAITLIERIQGVKINITKITIAEYHNYLHQISEYKKAS